MKANQFNIYPAMNKDRDSLSSIITAALRPVAQRFDLTKENCPKHPSNCTAGWIAADFKRGVKYFFIACQGLPIGCVGLEIAENATCYMERLAVLPAYRNKGAGQQLVAHVIRTAQRMGMHTVSVGIIAADRRLKNGYTDQGFVFGPCKHFAHLPFEVQLMFLSLSF